MAIRYDAGLLDDGRQPLFCDCQTLCASRVSMRILICYYILHIETPRAIHGFAAGRVIERVVATREIFLLLFTPR